MWQYSAHMRMYVHAYSNGNQCTNPCENLNKVSIFAFVDRGLCDNRRGTKFMCHGLSACGNHMPYGHHWFPFVWLWDFKNVFGLISPKCVQHKCNIAQRGSELGTNIDKTDPQVTNPLKWTWMEHMVDRQKMSDTIWVIQKPGYVFFIVCIKELK